MISQVGAVCLSAMEAGSTCLCTEVSLQCTYVLFTASVPEALRQLDLHQYLEIMEENEVGGEGREFSSCSAHHHNFRAS